jgi:hypothetical protein
MAKTPSEVLRKTKVADKKQDKDNDKDDKKPANRRNALIDFIAANKGK